MAIRNLLPSVWRNERSLWSPLREMTRMQRRMDRMFDDLFSESLPTLVRPTEEWPEITEEFSPPCDVNETDTHFLLSFDLPGVKKDEIKIECRDNRVIVSGERKKEKKEEVKGQISQERFYGSFTRTFALPTHVNFDQAEANFEEGVLQIALPKVEVSEAKQIPIKEGKLLLHKKEIKSEKAA